MVKYFKLLLVIGLILSCLGCNQEKPQLKEYILEDFAMDTLINIKIYASNDKLAERALSEAFTEFRRIEILTDRFAEKNLPNPEQSDVYRINKNAGIKPVKVSADTFSLIDTSVQYASLSEGAFDITIGPIMNLWGFGQEDKQVPTEAELSNILPLVGWEQLILEPETQTVFLPQSGMEVDLGAIAKGYATDRAKEKLTEAGIKSALINAGGNVLALGAKPDGSPWLTGIQDPRDSTKIIAVLELIDTAAVTSGDYQRFFRQDEVLYHHILDPSTGKPACSSISTTIVASNATEADILSTVYFVSGFTKGSKNFRDVTDAQVIFIDDKQNVFYTAGLYQQLDFKADEKYIIHQP